MPPVAARRLLVCPGHRPGAKGCGWGASETPSPRASGTREWETKAEGLPQLLGIGKTSAPVTTSRTPATAEAEGQSLRQRDKASDTPKARDKGLSHHSHPTRGVRGAPACLPSPCTPKTSSHVLPEQGEQSRVMGTSGRTQCSPCSHSGCQVLLSGEWSQGPA